MNNRVHFWRFSVILLILTAILSVLHRYPERDVHTQRVALMKARADSAWKSDHGLWLGELRAQSQERTRLLGKALDAWNRRCACDTVPCPPKAGPKPVSKRRRTCGCDISIGSIWNWGRINGLPAPTVFADSTDTLQAWWRRGAHVAHERAGLEQALMVAEQNYLREVATLLQGCEMPVHPVAPNMHQP